MIVEIQKGVSNETPLTSERRNKMWIMREFKTRENMNKFIEKNSGKIQYREVFVNNSFCIEYRKLIKAG